MANTAQLKKEYKEKIAPALQKQFNYTSAMQIPVLKKIVVNQGLGDATQDKKIIEVAINEITAICGQKAVATYSKKDIANFKLRKKMPIGVMVTLRRERMYEFLEKLVRIALPRIRDFKGTPAQTAPVAETVAPAVETDPVVAGPEPAAEAVPAAPAPAAEPQYTTYEVQDGEDMTAICIRFNASAAVIRELNNLPEGAQLTKGQIIKLPPEAQQ